MASMRAAWAMAGALLAGCASAAPARSASEEALARVAAIHGGAGPFAVAGYRMGERALTELSLARGSFDVEVEHTSPAQVQYSCIADGVAASTGASVGRLNLRRVDTTDGTTHTQVQRALGGAAADGRVPGEVSRRPDAGPRGGRAGGAGPSRR